MRARACGDLGGIALSCACVCACVYLHLIRVKFGGNTVYTAVSCICHIHYAQCLLSRKTKSEVGGEDSSHGQRRQAVMVNAWTPWPRYEEREAGRHHSPLQPPRQHCHVESAVTINPFTAMLAESSLGKRPVKVPLTLEGRKEGARERASMKMHSIERRFLTGLSDILFAGVYVCTFQP